MFALITGCAFELPFPLSCVYVFVSKKNASREEFYARFVSMENLM